MIVDAGDIGTPLIETVLLPIVTLGAIGFLVHYIVLGDRVPECSSRIARRTGCSSFSARGSSSWRSRTSGRSTRCARCGIRRSSS